MRLEGARGLVLGGIAQPAAERAVVVRGRRGRLGRVVAGVPLDDGLAARVRRSAGIEQSDHVAFVRSGWITAATGMLAAPSALPPIRTD